MMGATLLCLMVPVMAAAQTAPSPTFAACLPGEIVGRAAEIGAYLEDRAICRDDLQCFLDRGGARPGDLLDCAMTEVRPCEARPDGVACLSDLAAGLYARAREPAETLDVDAYLLAASPLPEAEWQMMTAALHGLVDPTTVDCSVIAPLRLAYGTRDAEETCSLMSAMNRHAGLISVSAHARRTGGPLPTLPPDRRRRLEDVTQPSDAPPVSLLPPTSRSE